MNKTMYALTYCYEGVDDNTPYACTIAVSEDKDKLREEMMKCVEEDCREVGIDEIDCEWDTEYNYEVYRDYGNEIHLHHKKYTELYTSYKIHSVKVI